MRAVIVSGAGRYADPWHPFARTSAHLRDILTEAGFDVTVDDDVDGALTRLDDVDLLVVNAGDPWSADDPAVRDVVDAAPFDAALARGMGVLAVHIAVASLRDYAGWAPAVGAMWVPTLSYHPEIGDTVVTVGGLPGSPGAPGAPGSPGSSTSSSFEVFDERYCRLQRIGSSTTVAEHVGDGAPEPAAWVRTQGAARVAVDVLGHDERSYASAGHRALVARLARWAARADDAGVDAAGAESESGAAESGASESGVSVAPESGAAA